MGELNCDSYTFSLFLKQLITYFPNVNYQKTKLLLLHANDSKKKSRTLYFPWFMKSEQQSEELKSEVPLCQTKNEKMHELAQNSLIQLIRKGLTIRKNCPPFMKSMKIEQLKKMSKIRSCAHFSSSQKENKLLWLKCLLNVIITPIVILWWCRPFTSTQSERHQLVTFTDGSDMYIHFKVLYIAVMLGIVQKEE